MPLDETVVADIYRDHPAVLRRFVGRTAIDPARAEDVVQEVILRVWRQAPEVTSMAAYLMQTARNAHRHAPGRRAPSHTEVAADRDDDSSARLDPRTPNPRSRSTGPSTRSSSRRLWPGSDRTTGRS